MGNNSTKAPTGQALIKKYQTQRNLTESHDARLCQKVFDHYDKGGKGYLDRKEGERFLLDVLNVSDLAQGIDDVPKTVTLLFNELANKDPERIYFAQFLKPRWGNVQQLLDSVYQGMYGLTNKDQVPTIEDFEENCPPSFMCPITQELMTDPVMLLETQNTYERDAIEAWLKKSNTDPLTNLPLKDKTIIPVLCLKNSINEWKEFVTQQKKKRASMGPLQSPTSSVEIKKNSNEEYQTPLMPLTPSPDKPRKDSTTTKKREHRNSGQRNSKEKDRSRPSSPSPDLHKSSEIKST